MIRDLHFAGRALRLDFTGDAAAELVEFLFGQVPQKGSRQPHATLSLHSDDDDGKLRFTFPGTQNPGVRDGDNNPESGQHMAGEMRGPASKVAVRVLFEADYHLADLAADGMYLHAANLARHGQALIMPASSGSGKSTLTCWLTQHGFHYMSDEATFVPLKSQTCTGFTRPIVLKKGSLDLFPDLHNQPKLELRNADDQLYSWLIGVPALNPLDMEHTLPIKSIVFPYFQPGSDLTYEPLSAAHTAFELAKCLINARNLVQNGFPEVLRLAQTVPAWRLTYGDVEQVRGFFDQL
jgi:hypothetical protein